METIVRFLAANRGIAVALVLAAGLALGCARAVEPELRVPDGTPIVLISVGGMMGETGSQPMPGARTVSKQRPRNARRQHKEIRSTIGR